MNYTLRTDDARQERIKDAWKLGYELNTLGEWTCLGCGALIRKSSIHSEVCVPLLNLLQERSVPD